MSHVCMLRSSRSDQKYEWIEHSWSDHHFHCWIFTLLQSSLAWYIGQKFSWLKCTIVVHHMSTINKLPPKSSEIICLVGVFHGHRRDFTTNEIIIYRFWHEMNLKSDLALSGNCKVNLRHTLGYIFFVLVTF